MGKIKLIWSIASGAFSGGASVYVYLVAAALVFSAGWTVNGWRLGEQIATRDAAENKALVGATANKNAADNKANDDTQKIGVDHEGRQKEIDAYAADNRRLRGELVRVRYERDYYKSMPGKTANSGQCSGQPCAGSILLSREDYELLLDFSGDLAREADTTNELYRTCRDWAFEIGRSVATNRGQK